MNILWVKDGKVGHEKQVKVLLDEISKSIEVSITEYVVPPSSIKKFLLNLFNKIPLTDDEFDIVIGAGHSTYSKILKFKKASKTKTLAIAVLVPSFFKDRFDLICAPSHDSYKIKNTHNVIFFEGSLAKVSDIMPNSDIGFIALGGQNKHYEFNESHILKQIIYMLSLYPSKTWYVFNSRRTSKQMNDHLCSLAKENDNVLIVFSDDNNTDISFDEVISSASLKLISKDSMNMVYEALSSKGKTYVFDMDSKNKDNKIVNQINRLINNGEIGSIEYLNMSSGLKKMQLKPQKEFNEVYAEVEKLAYKLLQTLNK